MARAGGKVRSVPRRNIAYAVASVMPLLVILLAYILRIYQLDGQSVWFDEGWSWHLARMTLGEMAAVTAADRSPALYYALLHGWVSIVGDSAFAMRFMSLLADAVCAALVVTLSRAITRPARGSAVPSSAILAGLLYAIAPFALWYAQETRMYAQMAALALGSVYWLWRWLHGFRRRYLLASAILLLLAIYSHYYSIFMLPAQGIAVVLVLATSHGRLGARSLRVSLRRVGEWTAAMLGVVLLLLPWLLYASVGFAYDDGFVFPLNTVAGRLQEWLVAFAGGGLARPAEEWWVGALAVAAVGGILNLALARQWRSLLFVLVLCGGSLLAATLAVRLVYPYRSVFHPRYLIYVAPLVCVLCAGAAVRVTGVRRGVMLCLRGAALAALALVWLPALNDLYHDPRVARDDVRGAVQHVVEALQPDDLVIMTRDNYAVRYYLQREYPTVQGYFAALPNGLHGTLQSDESVAELLAQRTPAQVRLFLWQDDVVDPQKFVESTMWANGYEIGEINFNQIRLPLYGLSAQPPQRLSLVPMNATFDSVLALQAFWMRPQGQAGDWFYVVLEWQPRAAIPQDYKVFVHVWDANGQPVFQRDKLPLNALLPMSSWRAGETLRDAYAMVIPAQLPAGEYRVAVGVYESTEGGRRLRAQSNTHDVVNDAVILGTLQVRAR